MPPISWYVTVGRSVTNWTLQEIHVIFMTKVKPSVQQSCMKYDEPAIGFRWQNINHRVAVAEGKHTKQYNSKHVRRPRRIPAGKKTTISRFTCAYAARPMCLVSAFLCQGCSICERSRQTPPSSSLINIRRPPRRQSQNTIRLGVQWVWGKDMISAKLTDTVINVDHFVELADHEGHGLNPLQFLLGTNELALQVPHFVLDVVLLPGM
jgi:hypothetical protein